MEMYMVRITKTREPEYDGRDYYDDEDEARAAFDRTRACYPEADGNRVELAGFDGESWEHLDGADTDADDVQEVRYLVVDDNGDVLADAGNFYKAVAMADDLREELEAQGESEEYLKGIHVVGGR